MMRLLQEAPVTVHTEQVDRWTQAITLEKPLPFVTIVSQRAIAQSGILAGLLQRHGYRALGEDLSLRATRYVRPLPLWIAHWCGIRMHTGWWNGVRWACDRGIIRLAVQPGVAGHLRDIRPWPMGRKEG